jgi:hypothetical protein
MIVQAAEAGAIQLTQATDLLGEMSGLISQMGDSLSS